MAAPGQCHLILDAQITQDDHDETILSPLERAEWAAKLRDLTHECSVFGTPLELAPRMLRAAEFQNTHFLPPAVHVKGSSGYTVIEAPTESTADALKHRAKERENHVRRFGFFEQRPISPLLALPSRLNKRDGTVIRNLLNSLLEERGISFRFPEPFFYATAGELASQICQHHHDTLMAVLPEGRNHSRHSNDTHEQIKQRVAVPSQCIFHDNAFPPRVRGRTLSEIQQAEPSIARRMKSQLDLCLLNMLVKAQWFPFIPAEQAHYNVHIGLDVGGKCNDRVVASIGYGFGNPYAGFWFKPIEIAIDLQQTEPVPPAQLFHGLLQLIEETRESILALEEIPAFDRMLFLRDGPLLGAAGADWNEVEALHMLCTELRKRDWISDKAVWTAVEIHKAAEGWRLFEQNGEVDNPLVGFCCFPFRSAREGLLCTTGKPYLHQGTAMPLKFRIKDITGTAERTEVARDLVWEADMCFTKLDMGQSLPWTLQIADSGALQLSRSYRISGITV